MYAWLTSHLELKLFDLFSKYLWFDVLLKTNYFEWLISEKLVCSLSVSWSTVQVVDISDELKSSLVLANNILIITSILMPYHVFFATFI